MGWYENFLLGGGWIKLSVCSDNCRAMGCRIWGGGAVVLEEMDVARAKLPSLKK